MIWTAIFIISMAQGIFLFTLLKRKTSANQTATHLLMLLTTVMIITNFDYFLIATPLYLRVPQLFGISFGMMLLMGPLLYLYTLNVTHGDFKWRTIYWLHFIPYALNLLKNIPLFFLDSKRKILFIDSFLSGSLKFRGIDIVTIAFQNIHLFIYLLLSIRWIINIRSSYSNMSYIIDMKKRLHWLRTLIICFSMFLIVVSGLFILVVAYRHYIPALNNLYTLITSVIIYFISYQLVLNPELITPGFAKKYRAVKPLRNSGDDNMLENLKLIMEEKMLFSNPELKLASLAVALSITPHQLSRLINERYGKSFNELINQYRVDAFIKRVNDPKYEHFSLYGIALEVGFNSKSSFNSTFKKIKGRTPSEFKNQP